MLVIRRCLFRSSEGAGDEKLKYYDIPSFPNEGLPLISTDSSLHTPPKEVGDGEESEIEPQPEETLAEEPQPDETQVEEHLSDDTIVEEPQRDGTLEEPQPEETKVEEPQWSEPELQDLSLIFGLHKPHCRSLYTCTEILGSESCDNMVKEMSEAVIEWSWSREHQKLKDIEEEKLVNGRFPPVIPRYLGRPCQFMKIERCDGRITMSLVQMDQQPEQMQIEKEYRGVKMQLMTYVGDAMMNDDAEASTSASTSQQEQAVESCDQERNNELETDKWDSDKHQKELAIAA